jgi:hypothetical protein
VPLLRFWSTFFQSMSAYGLSAYRLLPSSVFYSVFANGDLRVHSPQDLAVQREGTFIFRYRAFDIFSSVPGSQRHPILAELYGGPFRVYSTREFPGLEPSTELTRVCLHLASIVTYH